MTNQTDRQQLELAAKAAGIEWTDGQNGEMMVAPHVKGMAGYRKPWNPRDDDGDALRLAITCGMEIYPDAEVGETSIAFVAGGVGLNTCEQWGPMRDGSMDDPCAATRLAIFRAAVEIGKAMK